MFKYALISAFNREDSGWEESKSVGYRRCRFIGSTICSALADDGLEPIILDNLSSGPRSFAERFQIL